MSVLLLQSWHSLIPVSIVDQLGTGGAGYVWSICEGGHDEEWRHSVAPIPADKLSEAIHAADDDLELTQDGRSLPPSGELKPDSNDSEYDDDGESRDDSIYFEKEVNNVNWNADSKIQYGTKSKLNLNNFIVICRSKQPF